MKDKGLLGEFLRTHKNDPAQKYHFSDLGMVYEPLAYLDVSPDPLWGSLSLVPGAEAGPWECHTILSVPSHPAPGVCSLLSHLPALTEGLCVLGKYGR